MVEAVGDVERQFIVGAAAGSAHGHGAIHVHQQVAAPAIRFAGYGIVPETDDVGGAVLAEILAVGAGDALVVKQYNGNLAPAFRCCFGFDLFAQPVSQLLESWQIDRMFCLLVEQACFHYFSGRVCAREACWKVKK